MDRLLNEQLVLRDTTQITEIRGTHLENVILRGRLECTDRLLFSVRKRLAVRRGARNRYEARTLDYAYHGWIRATKQHVIRFDNAHDDRPVHCHRFDLTSGEETGVHYYDDMADFPTLDEAIREAIGLARQITAMRSRRPRDREPK